MGIFLDPRFKLILSEDERQKSKRWIKDLHQQMLAVETRVHEIGQEEEQGDTSNSLSSPGCSRDPTTLNSISGDSFQSDLQSLEDILNLSQRIRAPEGTVALDLDFYIAEYLTTPRLALSENTIEYWSSKSHRLAH